MQYNSTNSITKLPVNKIFTVLFALLLLCTTALHAQDDRHIAISGEYFTIGDLIREIETQADIRIVNISPAVDRGEMVGQAASPEFVRSVTEQVLAGTDYTFRSAATYTVVVVERTDSRGLRVLEQVFVDTSTGRIVGIGDIFGDAALGTRAGTIEDMLVTQVLSGGTYTYRSSGTYTIITVMVNERGRQVERQIVVDRATGRIVPIETLLDPARRVQPDLVTDLDFDVYRFPPDYFPRFAIKTNLLYGATATPNLGVEFFLNRFLTLDISAGWNPFVFRENTKFAHWMVQPTLRYWIQEPFNGHFLGLSTMFVDFNIGTIRYPYDWFGVFPRIKDYRFRGQAYSVSLQYGHQWVLSPRWSIEASVNVGYMFLNFRRYEGGWCGDFLQRQSQHYFGPTNAGISLIYIIR